MEIRIKRNQSRTIYPDIDDNLSLPEGERFGVELEKPSQQRLADASVEIITDEYGNVRQRVNTNAITRAYIKRLINPPELVINDRRRKMKIEDIFRFDEFADLATQIDRAMGEMRDEEDGPKNS
jgi:hypothetical protein